MVIPPAWTFTKAQSGIAIGRGMHKGIGRARRQPHVVECWRCAQLQVGPHARSGPDGTGRAS